MIFDQFEELYSKPELFGIFKAARDLMLDVAGHKGNLVLGFAWKTDSTTQQDHPAYHMWHELADHRREYRLEVFDNGEISKSITKFEKEVNQKLTAETRHLISQASQGFPWLLKKLCINLYESMNKGEKTDSLLIDLDIGRLFEADLNTLSPQETVCLRLIATKAPADWSEIIETSGITILNSLVHKRLVVRSGDRLNVYWDIFKDYLLTGNVPVVPYNYIPTTDPSSVINVCKHLKSHSFIDSNTLASQLSLTEKTIWNIGADLVMLGLAERDGTSFKLSKKISSNADSIILGQLRSKMNNHALKIAIYKKHSGKTVSQETIREILKECLPKAKYGPKTWNIYSSRLTNYLIYTGFITRVGHNCVIQDSGGPISDFDITTRRGKQKGTVFSISVSPYSALETLDKILSGVTLTQKLQRNSLTALKRLDLVVIDKGCAIVNSEIIQRSGGTKEAIWTAAKNEVSLLRCIAIMTEHPEIESKDLATIISEEYKLNWSDGSKIRNGAVLKQWSTWIKEGIEASYIPNPPGRAPGKI
ncbi:hypothetical protein [Citrobacter freundii]|uniref:hypothetical protein n=1 Tax=Citrobacter freundii TaxID=546 RepID=UPI002DBF1901|nr:hypothetical protein [Citrobacter freundii]MEB6429096.1 hypothetical protein [Citrobacter freundii]